MAITVKIRNTQVGVGDTVKVHSLLVEGEKTRQHVFQGVLIKIRGRGENKSFTVRRIGLGNVGIERIWPVNSPWLKKVELVRKGNPRRAKLYYLRGRKGREALKVKERSEINAQPKKTKRSASGNKSRKTPKK